MPQLDTYTYFSQVFWLLVIFTIFYILILNNILPNISRIVKLRNKQINAVNSSNVTEEHRIVMSITSGLLRSSLNASIMVLNNVHNSSSIWLGISIKETNKKRLLDLNKFYLKSIGDLKGQVILITNFLNKKKKNKRI